MKFNFSHLTNDEFFIRHFNKSQESFLLYPSFFSLKESNVRKWIILEAFRRTNLKLPINWQYRHNLQNDKDLLFLFKKGYLKVIRFGFSFSSNKRQSYLVLKEVS